MKKFKRHSDYGFWEQDIRMTLAMADFQFPTAAQYGISVSG